MVHSYLDRSWNLTLLRARVNARYWFILPSDQIGGPSKSFVGRPSIPVVPGSGDIPFGWGSPEIGQETRDLSLPGRIVRKIARTWEPKASFNLSAPSGDQAVARIGDPSDAREGSPIGDHLEWFSDIWERTTSDSWVRETIKYGLTLEFYYHPPKLLYKVPNIKKCNQGKLGSHGHLPSGRNSSHRTCTKGSGRKGVLLHSVCGYQDLRRMEGDTGLKGSESFLDVQKIQDADPKVHTRQYQKRGFPLIHRPHRGVPAYPHTSGTSQVPQVLLRTPALPMQSTSLWSILSSKGLHKGLGSLGNSPQAVTSAGAVLSRRHSSPVQFLSVGPIRSTDHDTHSSEAWVLSELQKEPHYLHQTTSAPWGSHRLGSVQGVSFPGASGQHLKADTSDSERQNSTPGTVVKTPGKDGILHEHSSMGQTPFTTPTMVPPSLSETESQCIQQEGQSSPPHLVITPMVDLFREDQGNHFQGAPQDHPNHRRQSIQLGCSSSNSSGPGAVVLIGPSPKYKLARTKGHTPSTTTVLLPSEGTTRPHPDGQCGSQSPRQQTGRDPILGADAGGLGYGPLGRVQLEVHQGRTHFGVGKSTSRFPD
ncbi:uncharacterized protein LOC120310059 isoform X1 [Crotalus tigris]|uniref:uncharacterized protein LOC120310059 isoform X1 n=1 Tax=Crotalus tigris TaxID=88082 RepID=UPI00192F8C6E|nr:uncharacterized protein LOC120310059 isoform X1 [Crotalus tigris]XP_039203934.1 uncharacterized protein LOC120310059 isoform X1 [Crotalus tigris]